MIRTLLFFNINIQFLKYKLNNTSLSCSEQFDKIELKLLCGADFLQSMTNKEIWKEEHIAAIIEEFGLFVNTRSGFDAIRIIKNNPILNKYSSNIILNENTIGFEDSSTKVRQAVQDGLKPIDLIHESVYDFIIRNELYQK